MRSLTLLLSCALIACSAIGCCCSPCGTDSCGFGGGMGGHSDCGCGDMSGDCGCGGNRGLLDRGIANRGCGRFGCGRGGALCLRCRLGARNHPYGGEVPHTEGYAGPSGPASPQVAYPYYTTRGPRDFLLANPPSIGR